MGEPQTVVGALLKKFHTKGAVAFFADTDMGTVWFGCRYQYRPVKDDKNYSDHDVWVVLTSDVTPTAGTIWGARAISLDPEQNVIHVLGEENEVIQTYKNINNLALAG